MKFKIITFFSITMLFFVLSAGELESIRSKISMVNSQIDSLKNLEGEYSAKIDAMDRKLALFSDMLDRLSDEKNHLTKSITILKDSVKIQERSWKSHQKFLSETLRQMYITGRTSGWELALFSDSLDNFSEGLVYLEILADARNQRIDIARKAYEKYSYLVEKLNRSKDSLENILFMQKSSRDSLKSLRQKQSRLLSRIRSDKNSRLSLLSTLEKSLKEIEKRLAQEKSGGGKFLALKGKLPCPLGEKCKILRGFGPVKDKTYGTVFNNPGVDFDAAPGQKAYSVADGSVSDVVWLPGYQYVVIVNHSGNFYTIYGNLASATVKRGDKVKKGEILGKVSSDNWLDKNPRLHFEIRHGKKKENPIHWLG